MNKLKYSDVKLQYWVGQIKSLKGSCCSFEDLSKLSYDDMFYNDIVKNIRDKNKRKIQKKWIYHSIKYNRNNCRQYFTSSVVKNVKPDSKHDLLQDIDTYKQDQDLAIINDISENTYFANELFIPGANSTKANIYSEIDIVEETVEGTFTILKSPPKTENKIESYSLSADSNFLESIEGLETAQVPVTRKSDCSNNSTELSKSSFSLPSLEVPRLNKKCTVLPKGSKNICKSNHINVVRTNYSKCNFHEGTFEIQQQQWDKICLNGHLLEKVYSYYFRRQFYSKINNSCSIAFYRIKYKKEEIYILAYCRNNNRKCKNFKIIVSNLRSQFKIVNVYSTSLNYCHPYKLTDHVRGVDRNMAKNNLKNIRPSAYRKKCLNLNMSFVRLEAMQ